MKKEEKIRILNSSASMLKESAEMLAKAIHTDYEDFTEKDFLERISISINVHFSATQALLFNMVRLLAENVSDDKQS